MSITQEQHFTQALVLMRGAAEHLHMLDQAEPIRDILLGLADVVEDRFDPALRPTQETDPE